ncbi:hypothetical protein BX661DRAFT_178625 [Kickxella alabastrina]|uniref:uncharacterized protein n=1 Tax=Kickxella alabastrina TaxID=61397 RepID=UPI00221E79A1|nr:uncharacterized protein BX661DRAFT_178625 [Kickxella alabastrina]KAI7833563.1 hypothetical protein BX661DRAFT_178625 [Kickxella alabastrina]
MDSELVQNFCAVTGAEPDVAAGYLQVSDNNVEQAVSLYFENGGQPLHGNTSTAPAAPEEAAADAGAAADTNRFIDDEVRAPIAARRDVLVDGYGGHGISSSMYGGYAHSNSRGTTRSIFNQAGAVGRVPFRDFAQEAAEIAGDDSTSAASATSRRSRLAELFKPPFEIMHMGDFSSARLAARETGKWVMVNIQDVSDFRCQALNRDIWRQQLVKDVVARDFVFFQTSLETPEGARLTNMYAAHSFPFIGVIDPKTGEMKRTFTRFENVTDTLEDISNFVMDYPLPLRQEPSAASGSSAASARGFGTIHNMTEEEQLAAAIAASELESSDAQPQLNSGSRAIHIGSDSEADSDYDVSDSYSEIHTISSGSEDYDDDEVDDDDHDDMDVDSVSAAHERMATQHATTVAAPVQQAVDMGPGAWYRALPNIVPVEPDLGPSVTRIQLRFPNGQRVVRRFAKSSKVSSIFQFLKTAIPEAAAEVPEVLFMGNRLADIVEQTIEEAKLVNASIVVDV